MKFVFENNEVKVSEVPADKTGAFLKYLQDNEGKRLSESEFVFTNPTDKMRKILQGIASKYHVTVKSINPLERILAKIQEQEEKITLLEKSNAIAVQELKDLEQILNLS